MDSILVHDTNKEAKTCDERIYMMPLSVRDVAHRVSGVFEISELNVTGGDDVAFAIALIQCAGTEANGDKVELGVRLTIGLGKTGGRWTVTHEHHSVPAS